MERVGAPLPPPRASLRQVAAYLHLFLGFRFFAAASDRMLDLQDSHMKSSEGLPHTPHVFFRSLVFASPRKV